jgi:hypothetical protein
MDHQDEENGEAEYKVGYGRPPRETQFKPGISGNPSGGAKTKARKKKAKARTVGKLFNEVAQNTISMQLDGKIRRVSYLEAVMLRTFQAAMNGDAGAIRTLVKLSQEAEVELRRTPEIPDHDELKDLGPHEMAALYKKLMNPTRIAR